MQRLLVFKPLNDYLFSGETSFRNVGEDYSSKEDKTAEKRQKYIIDTDKMPPQSTLLGTVRYLLLQEAGMLKPKWNYTSSEKAEMAELIGKRSFSLSEPSNSMGAIEGISPAFVVAIDNEQPRYAYLAAPLDAKYIDTETGKYQPLPVATDDGLWTLKGFEAKSFPQPGYMRFKLKGSEELPYSFDGATDQWQNEDTLFCTYESPGFRRALGQEEDEDSYHIKTRAKLMPITLDEKQHMTAFATILTLKDDNGKIEDLSGDLGIVSMGTKNGMFQVSAYQWEGNVTPAIAAPTAAAKWKRVYLPAPARLPEKWQDTARALMTTRNVRTAETVDDDTGGRLSLPATRYTFAQAGSVFFFEGENERKRFTDELEADPAFVAGYNHAIAYESTEGEK